MTILITGATGLIGKELTQLLLAKKHTVHYLTTSKSKIGEQFGCIGFYWNPQEGKIDENCLYGVDVIVHLAGANIAHRWTNTYKQEIIESRILSGELLFNLVKKHPNQVKQIISASGISIYPESFSTVYDETTLDSEDSFLSNVVKKWEEAADRFQVLGLKVCKLRTGIVLSNKGGALPEMVKPIKLGFGAAMGSGKQIQSWIHIADLVAIYSFVIENQLEGVFNAVAPNTVSNQQLTKVIAQRLQKPLLLPRIPKFVMQLVLGEMSYLLFSSKNLSAQKIIQAGYRFQFPEIDKAIANLYP
ncbi:TIGR01777 family protein [Flavobacterium silvisoli]|uniref:TIGR01777 family protein n=1 Tax=Flavobacterium silvisoli TaxID=2529433 RepID=A0A4V2L546_9FLAO|nr:TIGR01777 family oxidoreductase [Flavobacterium silvisoli]TBX68708.1 TIGR01777 family protein [Flavobacterium silvisoli]